MAGAPPPGGDRDVVLNKVEQELRRKDAIMEPGVMDKLRQYVKAGGQPSTAIEMLSENYKGYAQMVSLACHWLDLTKEAARPEEREKNRAGNKLNELFLLEQIVKDKFDAVKMDLCSSTRTAAPKWMGEMILERRGRDLIYQLVEQHNNCLVLNLAIRTIWKHGHTDEIAKLGRAASRFFSIFHVLLAQRLGVVLTAPTDAERAAAMAELVSLCRDPSAFVFAQMLLRRLGSEPGPAGGPFRRVAEELEAAAVRAPGQRDLVRGIAPLLTSEPGVESVTRAVSALLAASSSEARPGSSRAVATEVGSLRSSIEAAKQGWAKTCARELAAAAAAGGGDREDAAASGGGAGPDGGWGGEAGTSGSAGGGTWAEGWIWDLPVEHLPRQQPQQGGAEGQQAPVYVPPNPLHSPALIEALLKEAFYPNRPRGAGGQQVVDDGALAIFELLAMGCATPEERPAAREALVAALQACQSAGRGDTPQAALVDTALAVPVAAAGILSWIRQQLTDPEYFRTVLCNRTHGQYMELLLSLCARQRALRGAVLEVVMSALNALGRAQTDKAQRMVDVAVELVRSGFVLPVLKEVEVWAKSTDPSLVRHFVNSTLALAAPPYSREFASGILRITAGPGLRVTDAVAEFLEVVKKAKYDPPLQEELLRAPKR